MIVSLPIVKCIKGQEGYLVEGQTYTVYGVTKEGHFQLMEVDPPHPYNCFDNSRFEDTGESHQMMFEDENLEGQ